jgi:hypothetical protein
MSIGAILIFDLVTLIFSTCLFVIGFKMFSIRSLHKLLTDYRANPAAAGWFEKYFLGFRFGNAKVWEWMLKGFSDKLLTAWHRISGGFFILFGIFFLVGMVILNYAQFTGDFSAQRPEAAAAFVEGEPYAPELDPADFVARVDHPFFTLTPGTTRVYEGETDEGTERIEVTVTDDKKTVLGINATVVRDQVFLDGELIEDTFDWYAQDRSGNVWYLGEDSKEIENGAVVSSAGSWEAGVDGAYPGVVMQANAEPGQIYRQEYYPGVAEDMAEVLSVSETVDIGLAGYVECLKTRDFTPLEKKVDEYKFYCEDEAGLVLEIGVYSGERIELVDVIAPEENTGSDGV